MTEKQPQGLRDWLGRDWRPDVWLGYAFCTGVVWLAFLWFPPSTAIEFAQRLGDQTPIPVLFIAFTVGSAVYAIYRRFLGEIVIFRTQHSLHYMFDREWSVFGYFKSVSWGKRRAAYVATRSYMRKESRGLEDAPRAEIHIVYLTAIFLFLWSALSEQRDWYWGALTLMVGMFSDALQHSRELREIKSFFENRTPTQDEVLKGYGFYDSETAQKRG